MASNINQQHMIVLH